ncbi:hypothetical protein [Bradyrhizobium sp. 160]|uniref:hypothetical protein n=1 Tax=Bradyrhizobium sp. 160 TaxID=2782634 RepID=UPI001FF8B921|nr:hypothetical protein [Bradyrhizobium sp. 160]
MLVEFMTLLTILRNDSSATSIDNNRCTIEISHSMAHNEVHRVCELFGVSDPDQWSCIGDPFDSRISVEAFTDRQSFNSLAYPAGIKIAWRDKIQAHATCRKRGGQDVRPLPLCRHA